MNPRIEYKPHDEPLCLGEDVVFGTHYVYGIYRVTYPDNFTILLSHSGSAGSVEREPLDLEDPESRAILIEAADRMRERFFPTPEAT